MNYAIIAAGEGSRLAQEGVQRPKPLVEINGMPLLERLISIFCKNDATSISIIVNEEMKEVHQHIETLKTKLPKGLPFHVIVQSTPSSMHSFFGLSPFLKDGKFCLTTVDTIFKEDEFSSYIKAFEQDKENDGMMAVTDFVDDEKPLYVAVNENNMLITGFLDPKDGKEKYVSGGIYCLTPKAIETLNKCIENHVSRMRNYQRQLIADGLLLKAYPFKKIVDVDHAEDIKKAEAFLKE
jgi:Nucleoside-diphosphate-sugar pyrophosphorylase involved in lipopolysaccharide biosynthesis/translation initiation factor 2B, gamma/epsilon subunits (eIF-2Bgamma/eIF-2Bepsilon)